MKHGVLFAIRVAHPYFADGRCPAVALEPRPTTRKLLAGRRLLTKAKPDGLDVLAQLDGEGRPFIALEDGLSLSFDLRPVDADLALFTDLGPFRARAQPRLHNADGSALVLDEGTLPLAREALATIEITAVDGAWTSAPPTFTVNLSAREARWIYYWVGSGSANQLAIVDEDPERSDAPIEFEVETAASEGDRIASDLAARYPDQTRVRLVSREALACRAAPRRHLSLQVGGEVVTAELPNPALRNHSSITRDGQSHDSLYQVLASS